MLIALRWAATHHPQWIASRLLYWNWNLSWRNPLLPIARRSRTACNKLNSDRLCGGALVGSNPLISGGTFLWFDTLRECDLQRFLPSSLSPEERLPCKQDVRGSIPRDGTISREQSCWVNMNNDDETWIEQILAPDIATSYDPGVRFLTDPDYPGIVWAVDREGRIIYSINSHSVYRRGKPRWLQIAYSGTCSSPSWLASLLLRSSWCYFSPVTITFMGLPDDQIMLLNCLIKDLKLEL